MLPHEDHQGNNHEQQQSAECEGAEKPGVVNAGGKNVSDMTADQQSARDLCLKFLIELKSLIGEKRFDEWFAHQTSILLADRNLYVAVLSPFLQRWMQRVFHKDCQQVALNLLGPGIAVEFIVKDQTIALQSVTYDQLVIESETTASPEAETSNVITNPERIGIRGSMDDIDPAKIQPVMEARGSLDDPAGCFHSQQNTVDKNKVNPSVKAAFVSSNPVLLKQKNGYALDNFIAGAGNQELIQSAKHLCLNDDLYFHGMYIYGGIGNGKTHLLQGMYSLLRDPARNLRVMYLTAEQFANYYIQALRDKTIPSFHQKFRQLDVLIVDDVEFLDGKQGIQEEFLRTLKQLENQRKRIIISADRHPRSFLQTRSELIDRYLACLMKRIEQPDEQVRQTIVKQRADHLLIELTGEVVEYLSRRFSGSIRELTGAVNCLHAYYLVHRKRISIGAAREVLSELERACLRIIRPQDIEAVVCEFFQITIEDLHSSSRARSLSLPRMLAMYLIRKHTSAAYTEIGRQFSRNHSTVISAEKKVEEWLTQDLSFKLDKTQRNNYPESNWSIREILQALEQKLMAC